MTNRKHQREMQENMVGLTHTFLVFSFALVMMLVILVASGGIN